MFSPALGRAFRSASPITAAPANPLGRAALSTAQQPFRPLHQRRLSSSKPSVPADNSKRPTENAAEDLKAGEKKTKRSSKLKGSSASSEPVATRNIPFVQPTNHLTQQALSMSVLLSQHRPMSIFHPLPEVSSMDKFDKLFKPRTRNEAMIETDQTLRSLIQNLMHNADAYGAVDVLEEAEEATLHLDSLQPQDMAFVPPPVPSPYNPQAAAPQATPAREIALPTTHTGRSKAFREHVTQRRAGMLLISVKRQRKLKMKKHKYKKLMKRTRLLRRKLDRL